MTSNEARDRRGIVTMMTDNQDVARTMHPSMD